MLVKKSESKRFANSSTCTVYEYEHGDKDLNIAVGEIRGRYPETGNVMNKVFKEIVLVNEGSGKIVIEGKVFSLEEGDSILIEPNKKYFWEGNMKLIMVCNPPFKTENHVMRD
jgi:mannose-6-phosphate isomerase-like protein (cupin superfamily)